MLPKAERLSRDREIKAVLRSRQYQSNNTLLRLTASDSQQTASRLVVVTPGKIGNAVTRNRLRRVFMAAYSKIKHKIAKNVDIVLFPRPAAIGKSVDLVADCLLSDLARQRIVDNVKTT